jgi:hypothetical protein
MVTPAKITELPAPPPYGDCRISHRTPLLSPWYWRDRRRTRTGMAFSCLTEETGFCILRTRRQPQSVASAMMKFAGHITEST